MSVSEEEASVSRGKKSVSTKTTNFFHRESPLVYD